MSSINSSWRQRRFELQEEIFIIAKACKESPDPSSSHLTMNYRKELALAIVFILFSLLLRDIWESKRRVHIVLLRRPLKKDREFTTGEETGSKSYF